MHRLALVLVEPSFPDLQQTVSMLMDPYQDPLYLATCPVFLATADPEHTCARCIEDLRHIHSLGLKESKYDWWIVGGRFDGAVHGEPPDVFIRHTEALRETFEVQPTDPITVTFSQSAVIDGFRRMDEELFERNVVRVRDLPPDLKFAAVLTPDGSWHEREIAPPERDDPSLWRERAKSLLEQHPECLAVACDVHS